MITEHNWALVTAPAESGSLEVRWQNEVSGEGGGESLYILLDALQGEQVGLASQQLVCLVKGHVEALHLFASE